jgi:hypothetical protein
MPATACCRFTKNAATVLPGDQFYEVGIPHHKMRKMLSRKRVTRNKAAAQVLFIFTNNDLYFAVGYTA